MLDFHHSPKRPAEDALCKLPEVQRITQQSRSWIYSDAGRAVVGPGFKLGGSRVWRRSVVLAGLARCEEAAK